MLGVLGHPAKHRLLKAVGTCFLGIVFIKKKLVCLLNREEHL
jgi:hypothetical protein